MADYISPGTQSVMGLTWPASSLSCFPDAATHRDMVPWLQPPLGPSHKPLLDRSLFVLPGESDNEYFQRESRSSLGEVMP